MGIFRTVQKHVLWYFIVNGAPFNVLLHSCSPPLSATPEKRITTACYTLIKKEIKFSSYIRGMEQLKGHIWLTASSYMGKYCPSSYMTLQQLHSEFPYIWGKFDFLFYQCRLSAPESRRQHDKHLCEWLSFIWKRVGMTLKASKTCIL